MFGELLRTAGADEEGLLTVGDGFIETDAESLGVR
jgi:hypothetical protein